MLRDLSRIVIALFTASVDAWVSGCGIAHIASSFPAIVKTNEGHFVCV